MGRKLNTIVVIILVLGIAALGILLYIDRDDGRTIEADGKSAVNRSMDVMRIGDIVKELCFPRQYMKARENTPKIY